MTSGSARDLVRISWSERDLLKPVLAVLTVGGLVISTLASYAFGLAEGGDIGSLVTIGAIAIVCTLVVLRAVTRHAVAERWAMARRLRIIGMSARHLRLALLIETAALALVAALTGTVLTRYVVVPLLTPYLVSMDVVPAGTSARWRLNATLLTVLGTALVAFVGTFGASLTLTRVEPAGTAPPGRANGPHGALRMAARLLGVLVLTVCTVLLLRVVTSTRSDETAFLLGVLALICLIVLLCMVGRAVAAGCGRAAAHLPWPRVSAPALLSRRWHEHRHQVTVISATVIATMMCVFLGGYPAATDTMARHRLQEVVGQDRVARAVLPAMEARTQVTEGDGVILAEGKAVIRNPGATATGGEEQVQSITVLGGSEAGDWLASLGATAGTPGVVVTRQGALHLGVAPGDELVLSGRGEGPVRVAVTDVVDMPSTFGDCLVTDAAAAGFVTGPVAMLLRGARDAPEGWEVQQGSAWVQALAPGSAVSNSGGSGSLETPLLVGAPLALCLTLAAAATATTVVARRTDLRVLDLLGMPRWQRARALILSVAVDTLYVGIVAMAVGLALLTLTIRPYATMIGVRPTIPWAQLSYIAVPVVIWLVSTASALCVSSWRPYAATRG